MARARSTTWLGVSRAYRGSTEWTRGSRATSEGRCTWGERHDCSSVFDRGAASSTCPSSGFRRVFLVRAAIIAKTSEMKYATGRKGDAQLADALYKKFYSGVASRL